LLDFFQLFGEEFDVQDTGFSVRGGGFTFPLHSEPPHPLSNDPIIIEDPLNATNNVGRTCWQVGRVKEVLGEMIGEVKRRIARWGGGGGKEGEILMRLLELQVGEGERGEAEKAEVTAETEEKRKHREDLL